MEKSKSQNPELLISEMVDIDSRNGRNMFWLIFSKIWNNTFLELVKNIICRLFPLNIVNTLLFIEIISNTFINLKQIKDLSNIIPTLTIYQNNTFT